MVGKPAPEIAAIELDTGRPVKLADLRGNVVIVDFWGYWCGVCNGNMPYLVDLHRKFAGRPLAILALHDQSVQSCAADDRRIGTVGERLWGGRDLPFRVLLDQPDPNNPETSLIFRPPRPSSQKKLENPRRSWNNGGWDISALFQATEGFE